MKKKSRINIRNRKCLYTCTDVLAVDHYKCRNMRDGVAISWSYIVSAEPWIISQENLFFVPFGNVLCCMLLGVRNLCIKLFDLCLAFIILNQFETYIAEFVLMNLLPIMLYMHVLGAVYSFVVPSTCFAHSSLFKIKVYKDNQVL
jgi:hypothetical protein